MPNINIRGTLHACGAASALIIAGALATIITGPAASQPGRVAVNFTTEYAAKFVCGPMRPIADVPFAPPVVRGNYATAINVHNPGRAVVIERKVAVSGSREPGVVTDFLRTTLRNDQAIEFGCGDILEQLRLPPSQFVTGFLVIHTPRELDVVTVYTAGPVDDRNPQVASLHTERVPARRVEAPIANTSGGTKSN